MIIDETGDWQFMAALNCFSLSLIRWLRPIVEFVDGGLQESGKYSIHDVLQEQWSASLAAAKIKFATWMSFQVRSTVLLLSLIDEVALELRVVVICMMINYFDCY